MLNKRRIYLSLSVSTLVDIEIKREQIITTH